MLIRALALMLATATTAVAQDLPALFDVTGVASDDVLNVRTRPMAGANIIGTLAFDAKSVEVVEVQDNWGRVNVDEGSGWASMTFLAEQPDTALPNAVHFNCFGTEPFWSLDVQNGGPAILSTPEGHDRPFQMGLARAANARPAPFAILGSAQGENIAIVMDKEICSDGMSDRLFGLNGTVVISGYNMEVLSGCCSIQSE